MKYFDCSEGSIQYAGGQGQSGVCRQKARQLHGQLDLQANKPPGEGDGPHVGPRGLQLRPEVENKGQTSRQVGFSCLYVY